MESRKAENPADSEDTWSANEGRREFLKKCGRYAAYTTPVVVALLCHDEKTAHATIASVV